MKMTRDQRRRWDFKQRLAKPGRYYGGDGTIHRSTILDIEQDKSGNVVAVWFRCQPLPFNATMVDEARANEMEEMYAISIPALTGVEVEDAPRG